MTAYDYSRLQATALRLIDRFGRSVTLSRTALGSGPAHKPGTGSTSTYSCRAVFQDYSNFERDGTLILAGDRKVLVAAKGLSIEPQPGDKLIDGLDTYTVVRPSPIAPGATPLLYTLQVRR